MIRGRKQGVCVALSWLVLGWSGVWAASPPPAAAAEAPISLAGKWQFQLDPRDAGEQEKWFQRELADACQLPGSTDENGFGTRNLRRANYDYLSRLVEYAGPAWYQRQIEIPPAWAGKRITLVLERCHWETRVWVDARYVGMQDSLCVAQVHDLGTGLAPGTHRLAIRLDNSLKYDVGSAAHSTSEQTQTNWNGIVGRIELAAGDPVWIDQVQVYPHVDKKLARVSVTIRNVTGKPAAGVVLLQAQAGSDAKSAVTVLTNVKAEEAATTVVQELALGDRMLLWDEFSPLLSTLTVKLSVEAAGRRFTDQREVRFGMRQLGAAANKQLTLNGRKIFLRGTLECCIFPRTGYPPTDVESWLRILRIAKSYGLNHLRFHSWCPPEAAFVAADQLGVLYHVEAPQWAADCGRVPPRDRFIQEEVRRILDTYGNHPSFGMLCMGNELGGDVAFLQKLVKDGKQYDGRHLYTPSTAWSFGEEDQFRVVVVRGLGGPGTEHDFRDQIAAIPVPTISHEIGQWTIYPNLDEIKKYTGVLRPRNFDLVRDDLAARGMLAQAADFTRASGKLMVLLYKEEIEVLLRTPNHSGFQLLDLHDFPGQGTALVGALDPFWDSKGLIAPEEYRRFCAPIVPLVRMKKRSYTTAELVTARVEIAQFGPARIAAARPVWWLADQQGSKVASGRLPPKDLASGELRPLGTITISLARVAAPARLTLSVALEGTEARNDWEIWVYPASVGTRPAGDVVVSRSWDAATLSALTSGKKVLLLAPRGGLEKSLPGSFTPVFWSPIWFRSGAGTMGIVCDPKHPALARFPTEFHTNWQWYDLLRNSSSMILDDAPADFRPIVQVIDNFSRNHRLGNLFEASVGNGRLMVCSIDLVRDLDNRPEARQLLHSLLAYMGSDAFQPPQSLPVSTLNLIFRPARIPVLQGLGAKIARVTSETSENPALAAIDGDPSTCWHTQWQGTIPKHPHELLIDLGKAVELKGFRYLPRQEMVNGRIAGYEFYVGEDGRTWGKPAAKGTFPSDAKEQEVLFARPHQGRFLRLVTLAEVQGNPFAAVAELDVILVRSERK